MRKFPGGGVILPKTESVVYKYKGPLSEKRKKAEEIIDKYLA